MAVRLCQCQCHPFRRRATRRRLLSIIRLVKTLRDLHAFSCAVTLASVSSSFEILHATPPVCVQLCWPPFQAHSNLLLTTLHVVYCLQHVSRSGIAHSILVLVLVSCSQLFLSKKVTSLIPVFSNIVMRHASHCITLARTRVVSRKHHNRVGFFSTL